MQIYGWELLVLCHYPGQSCDHKHCDGEVIMFLVYHVTSRESMFKGLCEFMEEARHGELPSCHVWWPLV